MKCISLRALRLVAVKGRDSFPLPSKRFLLLEIIIILHTTLPFKQLLIRPLDVTSKTNITMERKPNNTRQRLLNLSLLSLLCTVLLLPACRKDASVRTEENTPALNAVAAKANSSGITVTEITFTATALINDCFGENIRFTGIIENHEKVTTAPDGSNHYTRHFVAKGMTGTGLETGTIYDVVGGAEMFSIRNAVFTNGSLNLGRSLTESDIVIHRGTLVFVSRTDGTRVVARHDIQKVPGAGLLHNEWHCGGQ